MPDKAREGCGVSGQGVKAHSLPATCQGLPGHAGTCLAVRSPCLCSACQQIGSWISIFTRDAPSGWGAGPGWGRAEGLGGHRDGCGPPRPGPQSGGSSVPTGMSGNGGAELGWSLPCRRLSPHP